MPRTKKTPEQKIAALEDRVKLLSGAVLTLEGLTKETISFAKENVALKKQVEQLTIILSHERGCYRDLDAEYQSTIAALRAKRHETEVHLYASNGILIRQQKQNTALREALKAVL